MTRSRLVFGTLFVALGVLLLLDEAGTLSAWGVVADWWPLVVVLAGVAQLVTRPRNVVGSLIVTTIGAALLLWSLGAVDTVALLWPVVLIGVGLWLLTRRAVAGRAVDLDDEVFAVFSDRTVRAPEGPLADRAVTTVFGDVDLDLTRATIRERATLHLITVFGDVDVEVPPAWRVTVSGPELLGDVRVDLPEPGPDDAPVLHLRLVTVAGDVRVRGRRPAHAV